MVISSHPSSEANGEEWSTLESWLNVDEDYFIVRCTRPLIVSGSGGLK